MTTPERAGKRWTLDRHTENIVSGPKITTSITVVPLAELQMMDRAYAELHDLFAAATERAEILTVELSGSEERVAILAEHLRDRQDQLALAQAEAARLRTALHAIADMPQWAYAHREVALAALAPEPDEEKP